MMNELSETWLVEYFTDQHVSCKQPVDMGSLTWSLMASIPGQLLRPLPHTTTDRH